MFAGETSSRLGRKKNFMRLLSVVWNSCQIAANSSRLLLVYVIICTQMLPVWITYKMTVLPLSLHLPPPFLLCLCLCLSSFYSVSFSMCFWTVSLCFSVVLCAPLFALTALLQSLSLSTCPLLCLYPFSRSLLPSFPPNKSHVAWCNFSGRQLGMCLPVTPHPIIFHNNSQLSIGQKI